MILELWKPPAEKLNTYFILGEIIFNVNSLSINHPNIDTDMLRGLAEAIREDKVEPEDALRALCQIFQDTYSFDFAIQQLNSEAKTQLTGFVGGGSAADAVRSGFQTGSHASSHPSFRPSGHLRGMGKVHKHEGVGHRLVEKTKAMLSCHPVIYENTQQTRIMEVYSDVLFTNWALNIRARPQFTFVPTTVLGIQNLVKSFRDRRIRCSGYRHSRAPVFADDGDILVSLLPLRQVTSSPETATLFPDPSPDRSNENELRTIQVFPEGKNTTMHVRVGSAVTTEEFRRWSLADGWALPVDVVMGEITIGGLNGSICRGSGYSHRTVNDYVRSIEYVDANGELQVVSSRDELRAAAGCFGLLGIVTHITYEVIRTTYAVMQPRKVPTMLAIPPLDRSEVPEALRVNVTGEELKAAVLDFEQKAELSEYAEWSWFPYQSHVSVNTWKTVPEKEGAVDYTAGPQTFLLWLAGWLGGVISSTDFYADLPARWQTQLMATTGAIVTPPTTVDLANVTIKTAVPNAQHSRRDYQYMRVRDLELEVPIPALQTDPSRPDWTFVRRVWWEVVHMVYASAACPLRLSLEMRIMADSDLIMAPQRGNTHGTVVIEISTVPDVVPEEEWQPFCQQVTDKLRSMASEGRVRPHWGKEWSNLRMNDMSATQYLKTVSYKNEIAEFKEVLGRIGKRQGWELKDLQQHFSNHMLDELIFSA